MQPEENPNVLSKRSDNPAVDQISVASLVLWALQAESAQIKSTGANRDKSYHSALHPGVMPLQPVLFYSKLKWHGMKSFPELFGWIKVASLGAKNAMD